MQQKRIKRVVLLTGLLAATCVHSQSTKNESHPRSFKFPVELILSPEHLTVKSNGVLPLRIRRINHSNEQLPCGGGPVSTGIEEKYLYDIRTSDGKPVPRIPGKEKERATHFPISADSWCRWAPGDTQDFFLPGLMGAFQMNKPGDYTVQVSWPDDEHPGLILGRSNVVTVTVIAPQ